MLDDAELLEQHPAHGVRRRLADRVAAVVELDRRLGLGLERGEVVGGHQAAGRLASGGEGPREAAAVEVLGSRRGEALEGAGEVRLDDRRADGRRAPVAEKHPGAARVGAEGADLLAGEVPAGASRAEPVARVVDRSLEERGPRAPAEPGVHRAPRAHRAGDRDGQGPGHRDAGRVALRRRRARRGAGPVEDDRLAGPPDVDVVEAVAAEARHERLDDGERGGHRHRRVDGVAAGLEREEAGLGGERVVRRDGAPPPDDQRTVGPRSFICHEDRASDRLTVQPRVSARARTGCPRWRRTASASARRSPRSR